MDANLRGLVEMNGPDSRTVTSLLRAWSDGDAAALGRLTLQPTALVNEE